jgi:hypothetical protein
MRPEFQAMTWNADWRHLMSASGRGADCASAPKTGSSNSPSTSARLLRGRLDGFGKVSAW